MHNYAVRMAVADLYPSEKWKMRVSNMPDRQVYAIYRSIERKKEKQRLEQENSKQYHQITLWEVMQQ